MLHTPSCPLQWWVDSLLLQRKDRCVSSFDSNAIGCLQIRDQKNLQQRNKNLKRLYTSITQKKKHRISMNILGTQMTPVFLWRGLNKQPNNRGCHSQSSRYAAMMPVLAWCVQCKRARTSMIARTSRPSVFLTEIPRGLFFLTSEMHENSFFPPPPFGDDTHHCEKNSRGKMKTTVVEGGDILRPLEVGTFRGFFLDVWKHRVNVLFNSYKQNWEMYLLVKHTKQKAFGFLA